MTTKIDYLKQSLTWHDAKEGDYISATEFDGQQLRLRLNDFPEEPMYTLFVNGFEVCDFCNWPDCWEDADAEAE